MSNRRRLADWWIGWGLSRCTLAQGPGHSSNDPGQVGGVQVVERSLRFGRDALLGARLVKAELRSEQ